MKARYRLCTAHVLTLAVTLWAGTAAADPLRELTVQALAERDVAQRSLETAKSERDEAEGEAKKAWDALKNKDLCGEAKQGFDEACRKEIDKLSDAEVKEKHPAATDSDAKLALLKAYREAAKALEEKTAARDKAQKELDTKQATAKRAIAREADATQPGSANSLSRRLSGARQARCATALCWGGTDNTKFALEPVVDIPIGMYWALGNGSLANHVNGNRLQLSVAAGLRYWFAYDVMSLGVILAQPSLTDDQEIAVAHSDATFTTSSVSRPFPTLMVGFLGDIFMATFSYDQLRNRGAAGPVDPNYRPNEVISRTFTIGIAFNVIATTRNSLGAAKAKETDDQ